LSVSSRDPTGGECYGWCPLRPVVPSEPVVPYDGCAQFKIRPYYSAGARNAQDKVRPQRLCVPLDRATGSAQESAAPIQDSHGHGKGYLLDYTVSSDSDQTGRGWTADRTAPVFSRSCGEDQDGGRPPMACQRTALDGSSR
jgi:hypothetical protein